MRRPTTTTHNGISFLPWTTDTTTTPDPEEERGQYERRGY